MSAQPAGYLAFFFLAVIGGTGAVLGVNFTWRRPQWAFLALVSVLPFHSLILLLMVGFVGLPFAAGRVFQVWKEALVLLMLALVLVASQGRFRFKVRLLDIAILLFFGLGLIYFLIPTPYTTMTARLYGLRNDAMFLLVYLLGRLVHLQPQQARRLFTVAILIAGVAGLVAILEIFVLPKDILGRLGFVKYITQFLGGNLPREPRFANLPAQMYAEFSLGGRHVMLRRAGSIYVNSVVFSFCQLMILPVIASLYLNYRRSLKLGALLVLASAGFVLGITRSAFLGLGVALLFLIGINIARRGLTKTTLTLIVVMSVLALGIGIRMNIPHLILDTLALRDNSSQVHLQALRDNVRLIQEQPLGFGLGVSGSAGHRFARSLTAGGESWYFQIALEMGIFGGLLFILIQITALDALWRAYRGFRAPYFKAVALGLLAASLGLGLTGFFLHTWDYLPVSFPFWLLIGVLLKQRDREAAALLTPGEQPEEVPA